MRIEDISNIFTFAGGLGMFLYGMHMMSDGIQKGTGNKLKQLFGVLTNNKLVAVLVGALITAIIQSSSATTVMIVGFVNAGIMSLGQAVGVIMGANIGTCITSWIVSLGTLGQAYKAVSPDLYAPLLIGVGAFMVMFTRKQNKKLIGEILVGLGFIFVGMAFMKDGTKAYTDLPIFKNAFMVMGSNPILGVLAGVVVTGIMQSSSAVVGILQTIASTGGAVTAASAMFISLGSNIGSCFTAMISSIGAPRNAKRAAIIHLLFNVIGTIIFGTLIFVFFLFNQRLANASINSVGISVFHTVFNVLNTMLLLPFANLLVKASKYFVKNDQYEEQDETKKLLQHLDDRILESPTFAVENAVKEVVHTGRIALENVKLSIDAMLNNDVEKAKKVTAVEKNIDKMVNLVSNYLVKISNLSLSEKQHKIVNNMFYTISNIERVGDHAENLAELAMEKSEHGITFSSKAQEEMKSICKPSIEAFENALMARDKMSMEHVDVVVTLEDQVDTLEDTLRQKHIERLSKNLCNSESGVVFIDALTNLERISDHSLNIANYVRDEI